MDDVSETTEVSFWKAVLDGDLQVAKSRLSKEDVHGEACIVHIWETQSLSCLDQANFAVANNTMVVLGTYSLLQIKLLKIFRRNTVAVRFYQGVNLFRSLIEFYLAHPSMEIASQLLLYLESSLDDMVDGLQKKSKSPMSFETWIQGMDLCDLLDKLLNHVEPMQNLQQQLAIQSAKTQCILAIAGHYKHMVGPNMIKAAQLFEAVGNVQRAKTAYLAVIADFEDEIGFLAECFDEEPAFILNDENYLTIDSLCKAYLGIHGLDNSHEYADNVQLLSLWLKKSDEQNTITRID